MSIITVRFFVCDGPQDCALRIPEPEPPGSMPPGWRILASTAHIPAGIKGTRSRLSTLERCTGGFRVHLCPEHTASFDAHAPITDGHPSARNHDGYAEVSCACGARLGTATDARALSRAGSHIPSYLPERKWWEHLPAELRGYVARRERP